MKLVLYRDTAGEWRWRRVAPNNRTVADSGEGYKNYADALDMARRQFPEDTVRVDMPGKAGDPNQHADDSADI